MLKYSTWLPIILINKYIYIYIYSLDIWSSKIMFTHAGNVNYYLIQTQDALLILISSK